MQSVFFFFPIRFLSSPTSTTAVDIIEHTALNRSFNCEIHNKPNVQCVLCYVYIWFWTQRNLSLRLVTKLYWRAPTVLLFIPQLRREEIDSYKSTCAKVNVTVSTEFSQISFRTVNKIKNKSYSAVNFYLPAIKFSSYFFGHGH